MYRFKILLLAVFAASCSAQDVPDCASNCTESYWGSIGDTYCEGSTSGCLCLDSDWLSAFACCLDAAPCTEVEEVTAKSILMQDCEAAGVSDAGDAVCSSGASPSAAASSTIEDSSPSSATSIRSPRISSSSPSHASSALSQTTSATLTLTAWTPQAAVATSSSSTSGLAATATAISKTSSTSSSLSVGIGIGAPLAAFAFAALIFAIYRCARRGNGEEGDEAGLVPVVEYGGKRMPVVRSLINK